MALTPLEIQKIRFSRKLRGYHSAEVEDFLTLVAEELAQRLTDIERLERENRYYKQRVEELETRQRELQESMVRAQKVVEEMTAAARREAEVVIREAGVTADRIVSQAIEQTTKIEGKITELRARRRELQLKFKNTLDLFGRILEADMEDDRGTATIHTLPRKKQDA